MAGVSVVLSKDLPFPLHPLQTRPAFSFSRESLFAQGLCPHPAVNSVRCMCVSGDSLSRFSRLYQVCKTVEMKEKKGLESDRGANGTCVPRMEGTLELLSTMNALI